MTPRDFYCSPEYYDDEPDEEDIGIIMKFAQIDVTHESLFEEG